MLTRRFVRRAGRRRCLGKRTGLGGRRIMLMLMLGWRNVLLSTGNLGSWPLARKWIFSDTWFIMIGAS